MVVFLFPSVFDVVLAKYIVVSVQMVQHYWLFFNIIVDVTLIQLKKGHRRLCNEWLSATGPFFLVTIFHCTFINFRSQIGDGVDTCSSCDY